ncbi:hypothetical protein [Candidatus Puniceispirillum marinum]|uniref:Uncharacterized protein n=1 Tax=Puniceispirillum marinum (strain IMCC1322) TaxID=488538 RepID=D5BSJ0_PUNMI|nr:hypothetical protein [Candidatus Puniceispirillum marinum]ADE39237.1 hypothetical protein SAR116_0994 [Candidatus Puniceispirillum marinum IMCC1322]
MKGTFRVPAIIYGHLFITALCFGFFGYNLSYLDLSLMSDPWMYFELLLEREDTKIYGVETVLFYFHLLPIAFFLAIDVLDVPFEYRTGVWFVCLLNFGFFAFYKLFHKISSMADHPSQFSEAGIVLLSVAGVINFFTLTQMESGYANLHYFGVIFYCFAVIHFAHSLQSKSLNIFAFLWLVIGAQFITTQITYYAIGLIGAFVLGMIFIRWQDVLKTLSLTLLCNSWFVFLTLFSVFQDTSFANYFVQAEDFQFYARYSLPHLVAQLSGNWATVTGSSHFGAALDDVPFTSLLSSLIFFVFVSVCLTRAHPDDNVSRKLIMATAFFWFATMSANLFSPVAYLIHILGDMLSPVLIFRNTIKFFTLVIMFLLLTLLLRGTKTHLWLMLIYTGFCVLLLVGVGVVSPILKAEKVPPYWASVENYVNKSDDATILLTPFSFNSHFHWGAYNGYRYGVPFTPNGQVLFKTLAHPNNRIIDDLERAISQGTFCASLKEIGITHVINRSDVITDRHVELDHYDCLLLAEKFFPIFIYQTKY